MRKIHKADRERVTVCGKHPLDMGILYANDDSEITCIQCIRCLLYKKARLGKQRLRTHFRPLWRDRAYCGLSEAWGIQIFQTTQRDNVTCLKCNQILHTRDSVTS